MVETGVTNYEAMLRRYRANMEITERMRRCVMAVPGPGIKFFTADAYLQEGWTAFAHRATGLLPAHSLVGLRGAFTCRMVATVNAGELVAVDLPRYDQAVPDLTGGTGRPATPEEVQRLKELQDTEGGG